MALRLWGGGGLALLGGTPVLAIAIWMVNLINGCFSFIQKYRAEKAIEALRKILPTDARVLREGEDLRILAQDLFRAKSSWSMQTDALGQRSLSYWMKFERA